MRRMSSLESTASSGFFMTWDEVVVVVVVDIPPPDVIGVVVMTMLEGGVMFFEEGRGGDGPTLIWSCAPTIPKVVIFSSAGPCSLSR